MKSRLCSNILWGTGEMIWASYLRQKHWNDNEFIEHRPLIWITRRGTACHWCQRIAHERQRETSGRAQQAELDSSKRSSESLLYTFESQAQTIKKTAGCSTVFISRSHSVQAAVWMTGRMSTSARQPVIVFVWLIQCGHMTRSKNLGVHKIMQTAVYRTGHLQLEGIQYNLFLSHINLRKHIVMSSNYYTAYFI